MSNTTFKLTTAIDPATLDHDAALALLRDVCHGKAQPEPALVDVLMDRLRQIPAASTEAAKPMPKPAEECPAIRRPLSAEDYYRVHPWTAADRITNWIEELTALLGAASTVANQAIDASQDGGQKPASALEPMLLAVASMIQEAEQRIDGAGGLLRFASDHEQYLRDIHSDARFRAACEDAFHRMNAKAEQDAPGRAGGSDDSRHDQETTDAAGEAHGRRARREREPALAVA